MLRNRDQDQNEVFQAQYEARHYYEEVAQKLADEKGIKIVRVKQEFSSPKETAQRLLEALQEQNIIPRQS